MTTYTELYDEIRKAVAESQVKEIAKLKYNALHEEAIRVANDKINELIEEKKREDLKLKEEVALECNIDEEALDLWVKREEDRQYLAERYSIYEDGIYLHKSDRLIKYNTELKPSEAYSVKTEMGVSWKSLEWILKQ